MIPQFGLLSLLVLMKLISNIFPDLIFIQTNGAHTIAFCPKMSTPITPFKLMVKIEYLFASETEYFGGIDNTMWIWSNWILPSRISIFLHSHNCRNISRTDSPISPRNIRNQYFGHHTTWYLHCHTACANFLNWFIEYLLMAFRVTTALFLRRYSFSVNLYRTRIA